MYYVYLYDIYILVMLSNSVYNNVPLLYIIYKLLQIKEKNDIHIIPMKLIINRNFISVKPDASRSIFNVFNEYDFNDTKIGYLSPVSTTHFDVKSVLFDN